MTVNSFLTTAGALALALAVSPALKAQGPLYDRVLVNLPYTVTIGEHTLTPGPYVIQQMQSPGGASRVLMIYSENGMKFETTAMTIPVLDNRTPRETTVVLHHFGSDYYFDRVWVQGKDYGYEFPLPESVKARERERMTPLTVAATYQAVPEQTASGNKEIAQVTPPPAPAPEAASAPEAAPAPEPAPAPAPAPQAEAAPAPAPPSEAWREMPETSAGWLTMLLTGGLLAGAGLTLKRRS
ncbi:MAG: hypothetical protein ACE15B_09550 [Bryobacteraceae bacterium]